MTVIQTENLLLRPVMLADAPFIQQHFANWDIIQFLSPPVPWPYPADGAESFIRNVVLPGMQSGSKYSFVIQLKASEEIVGATDLKRESAEGEWSRGFWAVKSHQGKGYVTEASLAAMRWCFATQSAQSIISLNAPANVASAKVSFKQGMLDEGVFPHVPAFHNGQAEEQRWCITRTRFGQLHGVI